MKIIEKKFIVEKLEIIVINFKNFYKNISFLLKIFILQNILLFGYLINEINTNIAIYIK